MPRLVATRLLLALIALAGAVSAQNAGNDGKKLAAFIAEDPQLTMFADLLKRLQLDTDLPTSTQGTIYAPTNRAITSFLAAMSGLTFEQLLQRPQLVDLIASYHFIPYTKLTDSSKAAEVIGEDPAKPGVLLTADPDTELEVWRSKATGLWMLRDAQGKVATAVDKPRYIDNLAIWPISEVLRSNSYFDSTAAALRAYKDQFSTAYELISRASRADGAIASRIASKAGDTYLVPTNAALAPVAKGLASAEPAALDDLFEYSVLPGIRSVPAGFTAGGRVETLLPGHFVTTKLATVTEPPLWDNTTSSTITELTVVGENGVSAKAVVVNLFAGQSVIQGIDGVIAPKDTRLPLQAAAKATTAAGTSGRRLAQASRNVERRAAAASMSAQNTQRAIRSAARGDIPVSYATRAGSRNARTAGCVNCQRRWMGTL